MGDNKDVDPRTYWIAVVACGSGASQAQIDVMARYLEAFYAKRPRVLAAHDLARRTSDEEICRFLRTIKGLPGSYTTTSV